MKSKAETKNWEISIQNMRERLIEPVSWCPHIGLISIGLVLVLIGHLFPGLNPRRGNLANIVTFDAPKEREGHIWISLYPLADRLVAKTYDHKQFSWPLDSDRPEDLVEFTKYLKNRAKLEAVAVGRSLETNYVKTSAILSVDQRLKYRHIKQVLSALAQAKISKYGFETRVLKTSGT